MAGGQLLVDTSTAVGTGEFIKRRVPVLAAPPQRAMGQQAMKRLELSAAVHCMVQLFGQRMRNGKHMDGSTEA